MKLIRNTLKHSFNSNPDTPGKAVLIMRIRKWSKAFVQFSRGFLSTVKGFRDWHLWLFITSKSTSKLNDIYLGKVL